MKIKLLLCLFLTLGFISINAQAQHRTYTISGIVLDSITNEPILGVYVTSGKEGSQTNSKGEYTIQNIPSGNTTIGTMYFSTFTQQFKKINIKSDTTINFRLNNNLVADEVVVTGTRTEKRLSNTPILTTVINENSIKMSGSTSVLESLMDNIPGIIVSPNAMGSNLRIKGLNSRYVLFLVDGERMVSEGASGNINLDQINVDNIQKIEMISGAASALYGSNAVGAVINIITKDPIHKFEASANIIGETNNILTTRANIGINQSKVKTNISAFRKSSDGFKNENGVSASAYEDYGANLKVDYTPIERVDLSVSGRYFTHETFNSENSLNVAHPLSQNLNLGINGAVKSKDNRNNLRASFNYNNFLDFNILEKKNNEKDRENEASYLSTRVVNSFAPNDKWEIVTGLEYNQESNFATTTLGEKPSEKTINDANLFAQAEYEMVKNFDIVAGARYTYNSQFKSAFTPKISLMYELADFKFRGGVGSAFRAPSIKELYYNFNHQGMFWMFGNPDLKAEKGTYSSLSTEYSKKFFNISISGYYNEITNKISQQTIINTVLDREEVHYQNVSSATLKGFDINASQIFFRELTLKANYSFCDAIDNSTGLQLSSNVRHSGTLSATWNGKIAKSPFSLQMQGILNSPRIYDEITIDDKGSEVLVRDQSKKYSIWKLVLVKPFRINKHSLEFTAKVDNLFDFSDTSYINSGRKYLIGLRYSFK